MKSFPDIFTIVDTETTGMRPPFSRIIDIGIIRVEYGKEVDRFETLINPGTSIPSFIQRFTSITDQDLATAPSFDEVALRIQELFADAVFVAHNAPFDYSFVQSEFSRLGIEFHAETLCSVRLSRALTPKARSHGLDSVIDRYGITLAGDRHRALPDADAVWEFFKRANEQYGEDDLAQAVKAARIGGGTPAIARDTFTDLPDSAGVYFFYGPEQELLYIGKSKHVRTRARSHFHASGSSKEVRLQQQTNTIDSVATSGELSALLLEAALIKVQSPLYNRALRKRKTLVLGVEKKNDQGYALLALERTGEIDPNKGALGVFRTVTQAKESVRTLAKQHHLCHKLLGIEAGSGACFAYQLGSCRGACVGKESAEVYNARFTAAFDARKLRAWPYSGTVMIDEKSSETNGTVLFIRDWILLGAYTYDGDAYAPLFREAEHSHRFEYDTYKILVRYLRQASNRKNIRILTPGEYQIALARAQGTVADEEQYLDPIIE